MIKAMPVFLLFAASLAACGPGPVSMDSAQRAELADNMVRTNSSVSGQIPPADNGFRY